MIDTPSIEVVTETIRPTHSNRLRGPLSYIRVANMEHTQRVLVSHATEERLLRADEYPVNVEELLIMAYSQPYTGNCEAIKVFRQMHRDYSMVMVEGRFIPHSKVCTILEEANIDRW